MELASGADDAASAIVVGCLLLAVAVIAYGFIARERMANPRRSPSRTGPDSAERGLSRTVPFGGVAVVIGHIVGSATRNRWAFHWDLALEILVYASALHFYEFVAKWREPTPTTRRISVAGLVLTAFAGSASAAYTSGIL
ncbi:hypothetical protein E0500_002375 [Streptomyces sp. KM273126]|uniref:hypothetical protein n=1 Tax=Streptomyces sp. KM273126 TaxID=2545247 RepID=UPI00103BC43D|nr:hypothetical protein [Streptomyces sp. KM273126]MBA2806335.1 hypothetical protein [Streptomyces sp. KM273126]